MVTLSLLSLCLLPLLAVRGEVAPNFDNCKDSFFKKTPVSGLNIALPTPIEPDTQGLENPEKCLSAYSAASPAYICQRNGNHYYFATLYDRGRRIPLYSAYEMDIKGVPGREGSIVYYEPQLVHPDLTIQQMDKKGSLSEIKKYNQNNGCSERSPQYRQNYKLGWSQALDDNFGSYDRGHLNPAGHHKEDASKVTMTHTNVAPQDRRMNNGPWNRYETRLKDVLSAGCSKMYVVTGVVPSSMWVDQNQRVNVPSHYWNAYCCTDNNDKPLKSGGALGPNTAQGVVTEYTSVTVLETELRGLLNVDNNFNIFNGC
ncbi:endonuclease domain-containing 1 protein [Salmo salar]|uniref:Endonuclease domain-containing 1 protein n=2 Tax=Salmo salar TaxID=8030 RepID=C0HBR4_SALSA|nr:endonuclease domain-containing 1 protein [Salmo salar]ACN11483.1 Endonuclease domain-containing 1 protein precursor [Salmo salar]|eukprot:XP_014050690.1 PREDICTED: endonuclease domain-containing 1 protein-like [Salmo salar]